MSTDEQTTKTVRVTRCSSVFTGQSNGVQFTIYEVEAERVDGVRIDVPLRSYEELPLAEVEVTVRRNESEKHGVSYTLAHRNREQALAHRVASLEQQVAELRKCPAP